MSEFNFENKPKKSNVREEIDILFKVALAVGFFCAFYGAMNWSFSAMNDRIQKLKEEKRQEKTAVDTTKAKNYMNNTHQIVIFQDTAKTK